MTVSRIFLIKQNIEKNLFTKVTNNTTNDVDVSFTMSHLFKKIRDIDIGFKLSYQFKETPGDKDIGVKVSY